MLIQILKRTLNAVKPADISSIFIYTVNLDPILEVQMRTGERFHVHHEPRCPNGDDLYQIRKQLMEAV